MASKGCEVAVGGVFINYRGEDSETAAALIDRELTARFGGTQVFLDSRSIRAGADFAEQLLGRLRSCSVLLVVIGRRWLTLTDASGKRRIDDPADWVRREIAEALCLGLRVIPVLTDDVVLPAEADLPDDIVGLSRRQYVPLRRRYTALDLAFLVERITEADPELAKVAARCQSRSGTVPRQLADDHGVVFDQSLMRIARSLHGPQAFALGALGLILGWALGKVDGPLLLIMLTFYLALLCGGLYTLKGVANSLIIGRAGIGRREDNRSPAFPWSELSSVEIRRTPGSLSSASSCVLVVVPKIGSAMLANKHRKEWAKNGYLVVCNLEWLSSYPAVLATLDEALVHYSGGRYQPESSATT